MVELWLGWGFDKKLMQCTQQGFSKTLSLAIYCHTQTQLDIQLCLDLAGSSLQVGSTKWHVSALGTTQPPPDMFRILHRNTLTQPKSLKFGMQPQLTNIRQIPAFWTVWFGLVWLFQEWNYFSYFHTKDQNPTYTT